MGDRDYFHVDYGSGRGRMPFFAVHPGTKGIIVGLVAIHVVVLLLKAISPTAFLAFERFLYLNPYDVVHRLYLWQIVTGTLLHDPSRIWHILFNCLMIFFIGPLVEDRMGLKRFLLFSLGAAVASSLAYVTWGVVLNRQFVPMLGASGAVMGMLVLAALWMPQMQMLLFGIFPMQLWVLAAIVVGADLLMAFSQSGNIAHSAHLGGALYGWLYFRFHSHVGGLFRSLDRLGEKRRQDRERKRGQEEQELRREIDRILDKVNREGMSALSSREKRFLKRASERLRR